MSKAVGRIRHAAVAAALRSWSENTVAEGVKRAAMTRTIMVAMRKVSGCGAAARRRGPAAVERWSKHRQHCWNNEVNLAITIILTICP